MAEVDSLLGESMNDLIMIVHRKACPRKRTPCTPCAAFHGGEDENYSENLYAAHSEAELSRKANLADENAEEGEPLYRLRAVGAGSEAVSAMDELSGWMWGCPSNSPGWQNAEG